MPATLHRHHLRCVCPWTHTHAAEGLGLLQVGRDPAGAQALTMSDRFMWQSLMEVCCRKGRVAMALQVS